MVVVAYAPTDVSDTYVKDIFHLVLFGYLKAMPPTNKVVVLGDFNTEFGRGWESFVGAVGITSTMVRHPLTMGNAS